MAIQSTISAASLFEGVTSQLQGSQTQGTGAKDDAFSKMMDRMIADAADRKRDLTKDAARQAQEARAEARTEAAKRQQAVRAERARTDNSAALRPKEEAPPPPRAEKADAKSNARDDAADKVRAKDDPAQRKATTAKADKATDKPPAAASTDATSEPTDANDTVATVDEDTTGGADADAAGDGQAGSKVGDDTTVEPDATLAVTETVTTAMTPTSDTLLASLSMNGAAALLANAKTNADPSVTDGSPLVNGAAKGLDPAAELAAKMAQLQDAQKAQAAGAAGEGTAGATKAAAATNGDNALANPADALVAPKTDDSASQALPDDDSAIPSSFADLIAAAKAKLGDKTGGKGTGQDSGNGRSDGQPPPNLMPTAVQTPSGLDALKTTADSQAVGALTGAATASAAAATSDTGHAHAGTAAQTHAALAAMEAPRAAGSLDMTQATASLRPSRGSAAPQGVPDQVAVHIKKNVADEVDQFTINLHPAELGRIDIKLDIGADGRVSAMVAVEKAQTLELLQRDSKGLERALQDAGLQTDSNSLNFSLRGEGNQSQADGSGNGSGKRGRGLRGGGEEEDPGLTAAYTVSVGDGRLDIKA